MKLHQKISCSKLGIPDRSYRGDGRRRWSPWGPSCWYLDFPMSRGKNEAGCDSTGGCWLKAGDTALNPWQWVGNGQEGAWAQCIVVPLWNLSAPWITTCDAVSARSSARTTGTSKSTGCLQDRKVYNLSSFVLSFSKLYHTYLESYPGEEKFQSCFHLLLC